MTFDDLVEDKADDNTLGLSMDEMNLILGGLQNRVSFRPNELQNQEMILEQIRAANMSKHEVDEAVQLILRQQEVPIYQPTNDVSSDELLARAIYDEQIRKMNQIGRVKIQ